MRFAFASVLRGLVDLLAPRDCPACGLDVPAGHPGFCDACGPLIDVAPEALLPPERDASIFVYAGPLADAIRRVKYGGRTEHLGVLGQLLADAAADSYAGRVDVIVPVPPHPRRLRERGFDPPALIARPLARALGVPLDPGRVRRARHTPPQAGLALAARATNVRGAFVARPDPRHPRVLVVDDVRTTGATLAEITTALRQAGTPDIHTLTLATAPPT